MKINKLIFFIMVFFFVSVLPLYATDRKEEIELLKQQINDLREDMEKQKELYESQIDLMKKRLDSISDKLSGDNLEEEIKKAKNVNSKKAEEMVSSPKKVFQSFNPDISVIIDSNYYNESAVEPVAELGGEVPGFGHAHGDDHDHEHSHGGLEEGFNIREVEVFLSADVDPYFKAYTTLAFHEGGSEVEEAVFQTTSLPGGLQILGGKFLSYFGRINSQHPHEWDFIDRPLIFDMSLGEHGLLEKGVQVSWLTPAPFHLLLGLEALQGENEKMFSHIGGDVLPHNEGPRLWVGWVKMSPNLPDRHAMQLGLSYGHGDHQEVHDGNGDEVFDHWLNGNNTFFGIDGVYKFSSGKVRGKGDITLQAEYFYRKKDLTVLQHDLISEFTGGQRDDRQDGYYIQALYGINTGWRAGLRWEQA